MTIAAANLSRHVITEVAEATIHSRYHRVVGRNSYLGSHGSGSDNLVYVLRTNHGAQGWGLPLAITRAPARRLDPGALIGRNVASLIDPEIGVIDDQAMIFDYALHDLAGNIADLPVHELIGGRGSSRIRCYSGGIYFDDLDPVEDPRGLAAIEENLRSDHAFGFRDFKLKIGRNHRWMSHTDGLARDIEVTQLARSLYPEAELLVDANDGYSINVVEEYLAAVHDCALYWLEEPFTERRADFLRLREILDADGGTIRIADGEADPRLDHLLALAAEGLLDVALMDVTSFGLTAWRTAMPRFEVLGVKGSPHAWGLPLKTLYAAQIAAGLGNVDLVEGVPGITLGTDQPNYSFEDGHLQLPERPGFGLALLA